jgi:selenocysteine-specific elongation factor
VRSFVIGTAGHVDHGKTSLVHALTGVDTDRLPEEKRRGISIELGFAPWKLAPDLRATVIDVAGHRRLVGAMIAGASGIELVLLVVAANERVMPQTCEHVRVCEELGIRHAVVALTKSDLVDAETLDLAALEVNELLAGRFETRLLKCSTVKKEGLDELRDIVAARLRALPARSVEGPARLWVDRVISVKGAGTVVTGTLASGKVKKGDALVLFGRGSRREVTARELRVHESVLEEAVSPTRLAVNLTLPQKDVHRGDLLTGDDRMRPTELVDAVVRDARLKRGADVSIHMGTAHTPARVTRVDTLQEGVQLARFALQGSRPLRGGDKVIVRGLSASKDASAVSVAGGGTVTDARPSKRSRGLARKELARAVLAGDAKTVATLLLAEVTPRPLEPYDLRGRLSLAEADLEGAIDAGLARGELVKIGAGALAKKDLALLADLARGWVKDHVARAPLDRGMPLATLQQRLEGRAGPKAAEAAILAARAKRSNDDPDVIAIEGDVAVLAARSIKVDPALAGALERARAELGTAGAHGVSANRIAEVTSAPPPRVRAILAALERQGAAVHAGDLWFASELVEGLRARVVGHFAAAKSLTVIEFKTMGGLARKQAVLLLEHFDQVGLTRRAGEARVLMRA